MSPDRKDFSLSRLDEAVVVVTGASSGLGEQFARALDAAGAKMVLAARRGDRLDALASELSNVIPVPADLAEESEREKVIAKALEAHGRIDGLVNNAGIGDVTPALCQDIDSFRQVLEVDLVAPLSLSVHAARAMREAGGGSIVNISSICALQALPFVPQAAYTASKAGLSGLTRELASQWAPYEIRVNAIAPGAFTTELTGDSWEVGIGAEYVDSRVPLRRIGRPGELDSLLLTLLHPESSYLTGQTIAVDGGLTSC
jgi:NAD(P)-dependent dehydrogenase (short-subunit alcohol dehydrogenase family)